MGLALVYSFCLLFIESLLKPGTALGFEGIMKNGNSVLDSPEMTGGRNNQMVEKDKNKLTIAGSAVKRGMQCNESSHKGRPSVVLGRFPISDT